MSDTLQIIDGTGAVNVKAMVNTAAQQLTFDSNVSAMHTASLKGDAYSWTAVTDNLDTTDTAIAIQNTSHTRKLVIQDLYFFGDVPGLVEIHCPIPCTLATTSGFTIVGINLNRKYAATLAPAIAMSDETATTFTQANTILSLMANEATAGQFGLMVSPLLGGALMLGYGDIIAVDVVGEVATFTASISGYYIDL